MPFGQTTFGQMLVWKMSIGQTSVGEMAFGQVTLNCQVFNFDILGSSFMANLVRNFTRLEIRAPRHWPERHSAEHKVGCHDISRRTAFRQSTEVWINIEIKSIDFHSSECHYAKCWIVVSCCLYYKSFMIINYASVWSVTYNCNLQS